jgi:hypothetical protein
VHVVVGIFRNYVLYIGGKSSVCYKKMVDVGLLLIATYALTIATDSAPADTPHQQGSEMKTTMGIY